LRVLKELPADQRVFRNGTAACHVYKRQAECASKPRRVAVIAPLAQPGATRLPRPKACTGSVGASKRDIFRVTGRRPSRIENKPDGKDRCDREERDRG
jgi:hypothetical protein